MWYSWNVLITLVKLSRDSLPPGSSHSGQVNGSSSLLAQDSFWFLWSDRFFLSDQPKPPDSVSLRTMHWSLTCARLCRVRDLQSNRTLNAWFILMKKKTCGSGLWRFGNLKMSCFEWTVWALMWKSTVNEETVVKLHCAKLVLFFDRTQRNIRIMGRETCSHNNSQTCACLGLLNKIDS